MNQEIIDIIPPIIGMGNDWTPFEREVESRFLGHSAETYTLPVSVVIPVFNRIDKLGKTIAALAHQSYPLNLIEVIIADDGSSDEPDTLIPLFESYFPLKYIFQEDEGYRLSEIRNKGVAAATHEHVIILDCDMLPEPTLVESFMQYAHISDRCVMIGGRRFVNTDHLTVSDILEDISIVLELPSLRTDTGQVPTGDEPPSEDWRYKIYRATDNLKTEKYPFRAFCGGNVCFHRSLLEVVGGFDESFTAWGAEDTEFGYRVYNHGYWFIPVDGAGALHQEPAQGSNETDREAGRAITQPILIEKCPAFYRKMEINRVYEVPKVSIYMPAYNCQNFVEEAIESALNQTYTDIEVVVVNDGSTDETGEILDRLYGENPRVQVIHQENGGISAASNTALNHCRGEYMMQLDSDDAILPNTVETLVTILDQNSVGFVYGDAYLTDETGRSIGRAYSWSVFDRRKLLQGMMVHHPRMFRMRDYRRITGFDVELSNAVDYDLFLKISEVTDGYHLQTLLYLYRQHKENTSRVNTKVQDTNTHTAMEKAMKRTGLLERIEISPDPTHPRRVKMSMRENISDHRLDLSDIYSQMGIDSPSSSHRFIWEFETLITPSILLRQKDMLQEKNLYIRVGSFGSASVAQSVASRIEQEHNVSTEIQSIRQANRSSYFVEVKVLQNDQGAIEMRRLFQEEYGWNSEIVTGHEASPVRARNQDTREILKSYEANLGDVEVTVELEPEESEPSNYDVDNHWRLEGSRLFFNWDGEEVFFDMPTDWKIDQTHTDLLRLAHYVLVAPWDNSVLDDWVPSRKPGWRPGLAFSGGVDSAAAMELMPSSTVLIYNERMDIEGQLNHTNAFRFFDEIYQRTGRRVVRIPSNHEKIRTRDGKMPGFSSDYACGVQVILLADYYGLDSMGTGLPLENSFLFHGYRYRDFVNSWFWKHHSPIFEEVGLPLYQPVAGCSEIINMKIVNETGWEGWAQSCLRSNKSGEVCGRCWKCFRKNSLLGLPYTFNGEIESFLGKRPLKQAVSTLYSIQRGGKSVEGIEVVERFPDLAPMLEIDLEFLNRHLDSALNLLPSRYLTFTQSRLSSFAEEMDSKDRNNLSAINLHTEEE